MATTKKLNDPDFDQTSFFWKKLGYTSEQMQSMARWGLSKEHGGPKRNKEYSSLIAHLSVVLPHVGMARIDDVKDVKFAAVQTQTLDRSEGPMPCPQAIYSGLMKQSNGRMFHLFFMPHVNQYMCPFVAMGWSLVL